MAIPLSWKIAGAAAGLIAAAFALHGLSLYREARHADEATAAVARQAALAEQQAREHAQQLSAEMAATLRRQREDMANTHRKVSEAADQYQLELAKREEAQRQEALRIKATYRLGPDQKCAGNIVITQRASSFTQAVDKNGQPIRCSGDIAAEPLRPY